MNMNRSFVLKVEARDPRWHVIDATDKILGRLATQVADILRGKDRVTYTPHTDSGDYVVVINCEKIKLTGNKWEDKMYPFFSGYRGGLKEVSAKDMFAKDPTSLIMKAVKGMLPKNTLNRAVLKKLRIYKGSEHPHTAQMNTIPAVKA